LSTPPYSECAYYNSQTEENQVLFDEKGSKYASACDCLPVIFAIGSGLFLFA